MKKRCLKNTQQGMTLIEILIAMVLGAFILAGVIQIFLSSKQSYRMQDNMSRMQENGRFAMEFISRDIRMVDYWGCVDYATDIQDKIGATPASTNGIAGLENDNGGNDGDADNDENGNNIWDGTDSITLTGASSGATANLTGAGADTDADFSIAAGSGGQFIQNDLALISNCISGDMFQITNNVAAGTTVSHIAGLGFGSTAAPDANIYGAEAQIYKLNIANYQICSSAGLPALCRNINGTDDDGDGVPDFMPLVEGIENMQILYGADTDSVGTVGHGSPNYYVAAGTAGLNMNQVVSIRINLLVVSIDDNLIAQPRAYTYNGVSTTPTDRRIRRVFTSTIAVRNRL